MATTNKGFIKDYEGNILLPITRGELILDSNGNLALTSAQFEAGRELNGVKNEYGLISAAERAMISGGADGQGIADIYVKLGHINSALTVGGTSLSFYDEDVNLTPITIGGEQYQIAVSTLNNSIHIGLAETATGALSASEIIKSITVDKYGRVTAVSGSKLTNDEIPATLDSKTLTNATLTDCVVSVKDISSAGDDAVASKYYVDKKFQDVTEFATGALKFGGSLSTKVGAEEKLDAAYENYYYKATADFELSSEDLYETSTPSTTYGKVKKGDTLIVYNTASGCKFVHVPSGDDITTITIQNGTTTQGESNMMGEVTFRFSDVFDVTMSGQQATINVPTVSNTTNGILSSSDYTAFKNYAQGLKVEYVETVTSSTVNSYEIGTLKIAGVDYKLHGINNVSALTLENGASDATNPILKFTESGQAAKNITIEGSNGVKAEKSGDTIKLTGAYTVASDSVDYLQIQGGQVGIKIGSGTSAAVNEGITKYSDYIVTKEKVNTLTTIAANANPIIISGSLLSGKSESDATYTYGSASLKTAITVTI